MAKTDLAAVANQVQEYWSPIFTKELRENLLLGTLVNKDYEGSITKGGDTVYVSQVNAPDGQLLTIGTNADSFATEQVSTSRVKIEANKRAVAAYEFEDVVSLQSQIDQENPAVMNAMQFAMRKQINDYLYSLVAPSTSAPDHEIASVTDFNKSELVNNRKLAGAAKWDQMKPWYALLDPSYYGDVIGDTTLASADYGAGDAPMISGQTAIPRMGFNILEDNSRSTDYGLLFHPDFMHLVMQTQASVRISDLHAQKKFGVVMSVDLIFGAKLGIDGANKHIRVQN